MHIEVVANPEEFFRLRAEWNELLEDSASKSVFLSHEWLFTWWRRLAEGRRLWILTARENGRLAGVLPLALRPAQLARMTPPLLEFIGSGVIGSDYLDVIVRRGMETEVCGAFAERLERERTMLQLSQIRRGACTAALLAERLQDLGWTVHDARINVCPYIPLEGRTWENVLAALGPSQRYNFQRRLKNLSAMSGFSVAQASTAAEATQFLDALIRLHRDRWESRGVPSEAFQTESVCAFHREFILLALERNWLRLMTIWVEGRPAAALYGLAYGGVFSFYQSGFDPHYSKWSLGLVMMGLAIRSALEQGCVEYDLLHGGEAYKFHWARETRELGRLEAFPSHASARFYKRAIHLNRAARRMASRVLQRI